MNDKIMYKETLQELFTERFLNEKIDFEKLTNLIEMTDKMGEEKIKIFMEKQGYHPVRKTFFAHYGSWGAPAISAISNAAAVKRGGASPLVAAGVGAAMGAYGLAQWGGYRLIRSTFDKCTKECGTFKINNPKRQMCLFSCKASMLEKEIPAMKKHGAPPDEISKKEAELARVKGTLGRYKVNQ